MKTGGSNYVNINGDYGNPPLGTYHLFPQVVDSNLQDMYEHGQRQITLVCFFAPLNFPAAKENHRWGHIISSLGGVMYGQHQENLIAILGLIAAKGYTRIHFRFAATAEAGDVQWTQWNADQFAENWSFMQSVRSLILANTTLPVLFDLNLESANDRLVSSRLHRLYCRRIWKLYTDAYGAGDTCGFSIIHGGDGLTNMLNVCREAHTPYPAAYCVDAYNNAHDVLVDIARVLRSYSEIAKPVYLQETNYNDAQTCADVKQAIVESGLNFQCLFQWPKVRGGSPFSSGMLADAPLNAEPQIDVFPDVYPRRYDNYLVEL